MAGGEQVELTNELLRSIASCDLVSKLDAAELPTLCRELRSDIYRELRSDIPVV